MGEIAEMMLDGTLCAGCGEFLGNFDEPRGFPGYCSRECAEACGFVCEPAPSKKQRQESRRRVKDNGERIERRPTGNPAQTHKPWLCLDCEQRFRLEAAGRQHWRDKHARSNSPREREGDR